MATPRRNFVVVDPSGSGGPQGTGRYIFRMAQGQQAFQIKSIAWEDAEAAEPFSIDLFPFDAGIVRSKYANPRGYYSSSLDASYPDVLVPPQRRNTITFSSVVQQATHFVDWNGSYWFLSGRYVTQINPSTFGTTSTKDLGASVVGTSMRIVGDTMVVCCGQSGGIQTQTTGGTWNTSADVKAFDIRVVRDKVWRIGGTAFATTGVDNKFTSQTANGTGVGASLRTLANWGGSYFAGDSTYQAHSIYDYAGTPCIGRPDGLFIADTETKFWKQSPDDLPSETDNFRNCWVADGYLFCPTSEGLLRIQRGEAIYVGPEKIGRSNFNIRIRAGTTWNGAIYAIGHDASYNMYLFKVASDTKGISEDSPYVWHTIMPAWNSSSSNFGRVIGTGLRGTNPVLFFGGESLSTKMNYMIFGRGAGRDIDDANADFDSSGGTLDTGWFFPGGNRSMLARFVGVEGYATIRSTSDPINYAVAVDDYGASPSTTSLLSTQEGGGTANVTSTGRHVRYAPSTSAMVGVGFRVQVYIDATSSTTGADKSTLYRLRAFGYLHPHVTDEVTVYLLAERNATTAAGGPRTGITVADMDRLFRSWMETRVVIECQIPEYEDSRTTRFLVADVGSSVRARESAPNTQPSQQRGITVTLRRVDFAGAYAT